MEALGILDVLFWDALCTTFVVHRGRRPHLIIAAHRAHFLLAASSYIVAFDRGRQGDA